MTISILVFLQPNKQNSLDRVSSTLSLISFLFFYSKTSQMSCFNSSSPFTLSLEL